MQSFKAKKERETSGTKEKFSMFIGRWQPWHDGHRWLIDQRLKQGKKVLICIRDVDIDEQNPFTPIEIKKKLEKEFFVLIKEGSVRVLIIPDIESVNYGRGVGYDIIEHKPPKSIKSISATKIRKDMKSCKEIK